MALIYLVEDDDGIGEIESFALKNAGHEVALLTSVSAFWKACKKKIPDLIVMDVMLPDADGLKKNCMQRFRFLWFQPEIQSWIL